MPAIETALGAVAPDFTLPATDGRTVSRDDVMGEGGLVVAFICNHCPYVIAAARRMVDDAALLAREGVGFVAICSNDAERYPQDSFDRMKAFAEDHAFAFPYLHDESQAVAQAYHAAVTPDFFGLDREGRIRYRGRLDEGETRPPRADAPRELVEAMRMIAASGTGPERQHPPRGCGIKWK
ncbi:thioredoxin family protein [Acuticoccus sp. M5D2P5]|uniref:thioredoxin family protein n=1 Tax=Acuticoccus kalidii TaxID=2910977 RepID=UPI001F30C2EC|nr:thioredoxin family protein [Acuticoccus kalidii]MCF3933035.1 thioredoxin family protein [Acuticoccus kalidii]